ncbi:hypothetical protein G6F31_014342 [Rhizopus arrhizus]|nr:hypothetical protein G6F31_014342 [Rhizopus arrhizus]
MGATARHFAGLVAGQLHRPILGRGLRVQHFQQRQADVADQAGAMPRRAQQVRDQRGGGALALGAGHAHGVVHDAVVGRVFGKPQRGAADERRALLRRRQRDRLVRADAGRLDHHIERCQRFGRGLTTHLQRALRFRTRRVDFACQAEQAQRQRRQPLTQYRKRGAALAAPAPQRNPLSLKLRNLHAPVPTARPGHDARPAAAAAAPVPVQRRPAAAGSRCRSASPARLPSIPGAAPASPSPHAIRGLRPRTRTACGPGIPATRRSHRPARHHPAAPGTRSGTSGRRRTSGSPGARRGYGSCGCSWKSARRRNRSWRTGGPPPAPTSAAAASSSAGPRQRAPAHGCRTPARMPSPWTTGGSLHRCPESGCRSWPSVRWKTPPGPRPAAARPAP